MKRIMHYAGYLNQYRYDTRAVAAMEYAIIVGLVIVGVAAAVTTFQNEITNLFGRAENELKTILT